MAEFVDNLDSKVLLYIGSGISFINSVFNVSPSYNFPLYLYSIYAYERENSNDSLRYGTGLLGVSMILDFIWLLKTSGQHGFSLALSIILLIIKAPTVLALLNHLRTRGAGFGFGETGSLSGGNTIWSMPGGFGASAGGYQAVGGDREDEVEQGRPVPPPPRSPLPPRQAAPPRQPASVPPNGARPPPPVNSGP